MLAAGTDESKSSRDSLMRLFGESTDEMTPETSPTATPVKKMYQKFKITSPDKHKLAMELVCEMDTPQKVPFMRELVKGSTMVIETLNNKQKSFVHIPRCATE